MNRPPTKVAGPFAKLQLAIHGKFSILGNRFIAGAARLALETRDQEPNNCIYCGGCMTGCSRGAGCLGTSEILTRSFNITDGPTLQDNTLITFPIIYLGSINKVAKLKDTQVLPNLVIGQIPHNPNKPIPPIQLYSSFDH